MLGRWVTTKREKRGARQAFKANQMQAEPVVPLPPRHASSSAGEMCARSILHPLSPTHSLVASWGSKGMMQRSTCLGAGAGTEQTGERCRNRGIGELLTADRARRTGKLERYLGKGLHRFAGAAGGERRERLQRRRALRQAGSSARNWWAAAMLGEREPGGRAPQLASGCFRCGRGLCQHRSFQGCSCCDRRAHPAGNISHHMLTQQELDVASGAQPCVRQQQQQHVAPAGGRGAPKQACGRLAVVEAPALCSHLLLQLHGLLAQQVQRLQQVLRGGRSSTQTAGVCIHRRAGRQGGRWAGRSTL